MQDTKKNKRRMFLLLILFFLSWMVLLYRLLMIQIIDTRDFSSNHIDLIAKSIQQRKQEFILASGRGNIYDRNLQSLLERREIITVIAFPFAKYEINTNTKEALAKVLKLKEEDLIKQINRLKTPALISKNGKAIEISQAQQMEIEQLQIPGIVAAPYISQDANKILAKHAIGYMGQAPEEILEKYQDYMNRGILKQNSVIGRSGLELTFQEILMGIGESKIAYFVDNQGHPLKGLASANQKQEDNYYPLSLVTTIDKDIQQMAEKQLNKYKVKDGSIVILDVENADILAMASAPDFDLYNVDPNSTDWNNKAVQVIEPGSIFKTVIAIAGLEEGVVTPGEKFYYTNEFETYHFTYDNPNEEITFEDGYAKSENFVFAEIARRLGADKVEAYANKLGLVGTVGWAGDFFKNDNFQQIGNEEPSRVFHSDTNKQDLGSVMRTAIGQQDVRISPLAAANLIVTVLNDGQVYQPRLVAKVIYKNGNDYYDFPVYTSGSKIGSKTTYKQLKSMMEKVVEEGTGQILKQAEWKLAGKSGTAETNQNLNHQWFIGYGPVENPRYAVAVAVKDVKTNQPLAKHVFMGIMDDLAAWKKR